MAYERIAQLRALSRRRTEQAGIVIPDIPALNGRLATIDPEGTRAFNAGLDRMVRNLAEQLQELPVDLSGEVTQAITDAVKAAVAEAIAGLDITPTVAVNAAQVFSGNYAGAAPTFTPSGATAIAFDESTGTQWNWFSSSWH